MCYSLSGHQDSNLGPPAPKAGALTGLRHAPIHSRKNDFIIKTGGGGGIRTRGTCFQVRRFSKPVDSATLPLLRVILCIIYLDLVPNAVQIYVCLFQKSNLFCLFFYYFPFNFLPPILQRNSSYYLS